MTVTLDPKPWDLARTDRRHAICACSHRVWEHRNTRWECRRYVDGKPCPCRSPR